VVDEEDEDELIQNDAHSNLLLSFI